MDKNTLYQNPLQNKITKNGHKFWSFPEARWDEVERQSGSFFLGHKCRVWNKIGGEEKRLLEKAEIGEKMSQVVRKIEEKMGI